MKIAITGPANTGKSSIIEAFLRDYENWTTFKKDYRDVLKAKKLEHSSLTNEETQTLILTSMVEQLDHSPSNINLVFDRCLLDVLVYSLHANSKGNLPDLTMSAIIGLVREKLRDYDIIFYLPRAPHIPLVEREGRDLDSEFMKEIDELYASLFSSYNDNFEDNPFFPTDDCPAVLEVFGDTIEDRNEFLKAIVNKDGTIVETTNSVLDNESLQLMEDLMEDQDGAHKADQEVLSRQKKIDELYENM